MQKNPIIAALDVPTMDQALKLVGKLSGVVGAFKVSLPLFLRFPEVLRCIRKMDQQVLLDLDLSGTPEMVAETVLATAEHDVLALTIRVSGDLKVMQAAKAAEQAVAARPLIVGVTVSTSINVDKLHRQGIARNMDDYVQRMAKLATEAGLKALICPPHEIKGVRKLIPQEVQIMTRGIRLLGQVRHNHQQISTPQQAIKAGANWLIIGRPIYTAKNPRQAAEEILATLN